MTKNLQFAIVASTGGSVMNELLKNDFFRGHIHSLVSDRECPALDKARQHGIPTKIITAPQNADFSEGLYAYLCAQQVDYVISFFTRMFTGPLLDGYPDRIINLHPSLLPAFKGLNSFDDALAYGTRYIGTTIHFIDEQLDEGKIIQQTVYPVKRDLEAGLLRHRLFTQQCKSLLQVMKWLVDGRISVVEKQVLVEEAGYGDWEYAPSLDFQDAIQLDIPYPF